MKKFKLVDLYDGYDVVGYADNMKELRKLINTYNSECDGECWLSVRVLNEETGKYVRKDGE